MDHPATTSPATARDIILEIVRNMREGLEPLHFTTLPPALFHVYLHPDDYARLCAILPRIEDESRQALDQELEALNRVSLAEKLKLARRSEPKVVPPAGGWQIRFFENNEEETQPGDIVIYSELALPPKAQASAGSMTKRIATRRMSGVETAAAPSYEAAPAPAGTAPATGAPAVAVPAVAAPGQNVYATIDYDDAAGHKRYDICKDLTVIGRGGRDYWTDLKLDTLPDVSREHIRLRRDPATGTFYLKDLSRLGTTVNGQRVPSSIDFADAGKRDMNVEVALPAQARIGLAEVVFLEFRGAGQA
jgi:hypothetical protein